MRRLSILLVVFVACIIQPVLATTQPIEMRLMRTLSPDWIAIDIKLQAPWKTYWKDPGEYGLAPKFDWSGSQNVQSIQIIWPDPVIETTPLRQNIYTDDVVLPVRLYIVDATLPVILDLKATVGICDDVCIPVDFHITAALEDLNLTYIDQ